MDEFTLVFVLMVVLPLCIGGWLMLKLANARHRRIQRYRDEARL